ncbi:MAG TPA: outer membrane beta-barrel protein [Candidatus Solibacter sp.]|nr:outer membrane beta-barrel protein [Candidatus Solibacter sp.]
MRKLAFLGTAVALLFFVASFASAQQADAMLGFGTVMSPGAAQCFEGSQNITGICPERGGLYMNLGGDVILHKRLGFGFDSTWRAGQGNYGDIGIPYRPILFDFNGVYQPRIGKKAGLDLFGGIGWQTTRFYGYQPTVNCVDFGACYQSSNHFLVDIGAGVRYYVRGHLFVRPEVRYYKIHNNTADFTGNNVIHVGASIGYTIGPD